MDYSDSWYPSIIHLFLPKNGQSIRSGDYTILQDDEMMGRFK